jgi:C4-dicarboxylate-specific signal transduction histidine kinase
MNSSDQTPGSIQLHPILLTFTREQKSLEALYADDYFNKHLSHLRACHVVAVLFYLSAGIIDFAIRPSLLQTFWTLRFGLVVPCFLAGLVFTFFPAYRLVWRQVSFFYILLTGSSFIASMVMAPAPDGYAYYIGIAICMIFGYALIREPFPWAAAGGCGLLAMYFVAAVIIATPLRLLTLHGFFLLLINTLGMFVAYAFDVQSRKDFFLTHLLNVEKMKVDRLAADLEREVERQVRELRRTNDELRREIDERISVEDALRISESNFRSLQSNIPIALYRIVKGDLVSANPAMVEIFKAKEPAELFCRPIADFFYDPEIIEHLLKELRQSGRITNAEVRLKTLDGRPFWGLVNVARGKSTECSEVCFDGTLEDIDTRKAIAEEKEALTRQLRQAQKMESLGTLAGGIAHDFNNILAVVIGYVDLIIDDVEPGSPVESGLFEVKKAGERAKELVKQILTFARQSEEALTIVDVGQIARETLRFLRSSLPATIQINSRVADGVAIRGNATQLHQIFMNLCTNAAHAMEDRGGVIDVRVEETEQDRNHRGIHGEANPGRMVRIIVADTGRGIPSQIIGSIFDPYFTTKGLGHGTGMGLAVVHGIVESYGGKIDVESSTDAGTTFTIMIPAARDQGEIYGLTESGAIAGGDERILVVDDEPVIADLTGRMLERLGYSVTVFHSAVDALDGFREAPDRFDLVISDMTMPGLTGKQLAEELLGIREGLPVILCTGYSSMINEREAADLGARALLFKPVSRRLLAGTIRRVLDSG